MTQLTALTGGRAWAARLLVLLPVMALIAVAVAVIPALATHPSEGGVTPEVVEGNPDCLTIESDAEFESKLDPVSTGSYTLPGQDGVTITGTISSNGRVGSFSISGGRMVDVIVKGGPHANVYGYDPAVTADSGLTAPHRSSGTSGPTHGISHISFCYTTKFVLSGTNFHDRDADGERTLFYEGGLSEWTIEVYDSGQNLVASTATDSEGDYSFLLPAGQYTVCEVPQEGWIQTTPSECHEVDLQADSTGNDFGNATVITLDCGEEAGFGDPDNPHVLAQLPDQDGCDGPYQFIAETWIDEDGVQFTLLERLDKEHQLVVLETITWVVTDGQTKVAHEVGEGPTDDTFCEVKDPFDNGNLLSPEDVFKDPGDISCILTTSQSGGESRVDYLYSFDIKRQIN